MRILGFSLWRWLPVLLAPKVINLVYALPNQAYLASFEAPEIQLNKTTAINYQINLTIAASTVSDLSIVLCQTAGTVLETNSIDETNSWKVLNVLSGFCITNTSPPPETCKNNPYLGHGSVQLSVSKDAAFNSTGDDSLHNFFFCVTHKDTTSSIECDYSSNLFNISPAASSAKPSDTETLDTMPPFFPPPIPMIATITSTKSTVLQTQTIPATLSSSSKSTSPASTSSAQKKHLSTSTTIGIAFGVFIVLVLLGFIALFFYRRSRTNKRAETARSHNNEPFLDRGHHAEKENVDSPTSNSGWIMSPTRGIDQSQDMVKGPEQIRSSLEPASPTITTNMTGGETESPMNPIARRSLSVVSRESATSVGVSPMLSPRSGSGYDAFGCASEELSGIDMGMSSGMSSAAPFLREEGMSPEEMARLEDEERRIDAAIAQAEAERGINRR
ncbi:Bgt-2525 [Blumeria graminis f. sp. tritici]|uniref:Bgt-2525 n=2 Tax=Blumeria graminis f. sp. tritici TaxID=62690 RepID=A0A381L5U0_BLUGR|nr:hypothetical protein BGT96224_2525 [Blumeria graminis f. sp. tritici 96224]VDB90766.1 Bgt-2525 [Blumeria graminis f. sp. tritici]